MCGARRPIFDLLLHSCTPTGAFSAASITATAGPSSFTGGIDNNNGGITDAGAISGATSITASDTVSAASITATTSATSGKHLSYVFGSFPFEWPLQFSRTFCFDRTLHLVFRPRLQRHLNEHPQYWRCRRYDHAPWVNWWHWLFPGWESKRTTERTMRFKCYWLTLFQCRHRRERRRQALGLHGQRLGLVGEWSTRFDGPDAATNCGAHNCANNGAHRGAHCGAHNCAHNCANNGTHHGMD
jgi:hypothetical protein